MFKYNKKYYNLKRIKIHISKDNAVRKFQY
jgi:hypothetical protein